MKMDKVANSKNDEFYTPEYAILPLLKYIDNKLIVWCPFDTEQSNIVKMLRDNGNEVIHTHIDSGDDFFFIEPDKYDVIISNPPYSLKNEVLERLFLLNKPFAMLLGVAGLFESERRFSLFEKYPSEIMWLSKRVSYFKNFNDPKPSLNPPFSSVWLCSQLLPKLNVFERIKKTPSRCKS